MARVLSLDKALDILEQVARHPQGIGTRALAKELELTITSVHNIAATLRERGYLRQDPTTKRFHLGSQIMVLSRNGNLNVELVESAMPFVRRAAEEIGESIMVTALVDRRIARVANLTTSKILSVQEPEDLSSVAYCTASGKMLLASLSNREADEFLRDIALVKYTSHTLHTLSQIRAEVDKVRHQGHATTCDELLEGVSAVAVPIPDPWGHMSAAIAASAPTVRFDPAARTRAIKVLQEIAANISRAWWRGPAPASSAQDSKATVGRKQD